MMFDPFCPKPFIVRMLVTVTTLHELLDQMSQWANIDDSRQHSAISASKGQGSGHVSPIVNRSKQGSLVKPRKLLQRLVAFTTTLGSGTRGDTRSEHNHVKLDHGNTQTILIPVHCKFWKTLHAFPSWTRSTRPI